MEQRYHNPNFGVRILSRANESELKLIGGKRDIIGQPLGKLPVFTIQSIEGEGTPKVVQRNTSLLLQIKSTDQIVNLWLIKLEVEVQQ